MSRWLLKEEGIFTASLGEADRKMLFSLLSFCCREKDIEMFLESSRSKFIGYTLGRWVPAKPGWAAAHFGGCGGAAAEAAALGAVVLLL